MSIHLDEDALQAGVAGFRFYLEAGEHGAVRAVDVHREPGFVTCDFADGSAWAFNIGTTDIDAAEAMFLGIAAHFGALDVPRH